MAQILSRRDLTDEDAQRISLEVRVLGSDLVIRDAGAPVNALVPVELRIPLGHVLAVNSGLHEATRWLRMLGLGRPHLRGREHIVYRDGHVYWNVERAENAVAISLHDELYDQIIVGTVNATRVVSEVRLRLAA